MPPEPDLNTPYFETPARTERLQLLSHLARNTTGPIYLRGPDGAGKTRLMQRLRRELQEQTAVVWVDLAEPVKLMAAVIRQLGLPPEAADDWPIGLNQALGTRKPVIVIDGADHLDPTVRASLAALADSGIPLILVGRGGGVDDWTVQFVDLPPFDAAESAAFLRGQAGIDAARITDELAARSHEATNGWPGGLLEVLHGLADSPPPPPPPQRPSVEAPPVLKDRHRARKTNRPWKNRLPWTWIGAGALGVLLAAVLVFQGPINTLIAPPQDSSTDAGSPPEMPRPVAAPDTSPVPGIVRPPVPSDTEDAARTQDVPLLEPDRATAGAETPTQTPAPDIVRPPVPSDNEDAVRTQGIPLPEPDRATAAAETPSQPPAPGAADAVDSLLTPLEELDPQLEPATAPTAPVDPLEAVLKDALAAAESSAGQTETPDAAADGPATAVDEPPARVDPTPPEAMRSAPVPPPPGPVMDANRERAVFEARPEAREAVRGGSTLPAPVEQRTATEGAETDRDPEARDRREPAGEGPAPVVDRTGPGEAVATITAKPAVTPTVGTPGGQGRAGGDAWLRSRPPGHFTLQLIGGRDRASIQRFAEENNVSPPYAIFRRTLNGNDWFSLIAGEYPDRQTALAARERLSTALRASGVWPRTFESVQTAR